MQNIQNIPRYKRGVAEVLPCVQQLPATAPLYSALVVLSMDTWKSPQKSIYLTHKNEHQVSRRREQVSPPSCPLFYRAVKKSVDISTSQMYLDASRSKQHW